MARQKQDGLKYFSFDTDFFYADKRIPKLHKRFGNDGIVFYIYLLTEIYRHGYYARWDEDLIDDAMDLNLTEGLIKQMMTFFKGRGLIVSIDINNGASNRTDTIITSPGIQKRYQEAVKGLKRDIFVDAKIWLLSKEETASCIKVTKNENKSGKNKNKSEKNENKSEKNDLKENKPKEINNNNMCKAEALALFERIWQLYPCKKGKGQVSDSQKLKLLRIGFDEMKRAIDRYVKYVKSIDYLQYQNGSTFFNSGYVDYLDVNYTEEDKPQDKPQTNNKNQFNNFHQRQYDYDELEKYLLSSMPAEDKRWGSSN